MVSDYNYDSLLDNKCTIFKKKYRVINLKASRDSKRIT